MIRQQLRAAQQRFYHYCRYAEYELTSSPALTGDSGPNGQALNEWLRELKEQNTQTARLRGFDKIRDEAERHSFGGSRTTEVPERAEQASGSLLSLGERGTPTYWLTPAGRAPHIVLAPLGEREIRKKVFASLALILSILVVWLISYLPRLCVWVQALWPEQMASLGVLGWVTLGPNWIAVFLVLLGVCGRTVSIGSWLLSTVAVRRRTGAHA